MKMNQTVALYQYLSTLIEKPLPIKTAYQLTKLLHASEKEYEFYKSKLTELITKYAERDENGNPILSEDGETYKVAEQYVEQCVSSLNELENLDVTLPNISINLNDLPTDMTMKELSLLMPFIAE